MPLCPFTLAFLTWPGCAPYLVSAVLLLSPKASGVSVALQSLYRYQIVG